MIIASAAINRTIPSRLKRNFGHLIARSAKGRMHLPWSLSPERNKVSITNVTINFLK